MTKSEVLLTLKSSRKINTMEDSQPWRDAFALYNEATGSKLKARDRCSKCFQKVLDWLQA